MAVRARIGGTLDAPLLRLEAGPMRAAPELSRFYLQRSDRPAWCGPGGPLRQTDELLDALGRVREDGLDPERYGLKDLRSRVAVWRKVGIGPGRSLPRLAELDLLLSEAFLRCARELQRGCVPPGRIYAEWEADPAYTDLADLLQSALDMDRVESALLSLRPPLEEYRRLQRVLGRYQRMMISESAGAITGSSVPPGVRIAQIQVDMERWRWLPHGPRSRYVLVRLGEYRLEAVNDGRVVLRLRAIVGRPGSSTPVLSSMITYLDVNPSWRIPRSIAVEEILPRAQRDPSYLAAHGITVLDAHGDAMKLADVDSLAWARIMAAPSPVQLVRKPGPGNPLGRIRFFFANPYGVYLHDTPDSNLFRRPQRDLSHGCIRVERAMDLGAFLLGPSWTRKRLEALAGRGACRRVVLPAPVPVYLMHWSVKVDEDGRVTSRPDRDGADQRLWRELSGRFPGGGTGDVDSDPSGP